MSHIFISYTHNDKPHLERLVTWLKENNFADQELWYDHHIESGNNWRDEIATALNEAFAVVVIVSSASVKSIYCTYEWAYALGQGIPILPLVFEDVSIADVPAPLASKQFVSCIERIPDSLKDQIARLRTVPPQVAAINKIIYDTIYDTHRRYFILSWIGNGLRNLDNEMASNVLSYFAKKTLEAHKTLETLMMEKAFAFTTKQHRLCWTLMDYLKDFSKIERQYDPFFSDLPVLEFETEWLSAFEYFAGRNYWSRWTRSRFEAELNEHNQMEVFAEIVQAFPIFNASDVDLLIHNTAADRAHKQKMKSESKPES